jgi:hypothetical protein
MVSEEALACRIKTSRLKKTLFDEPKGDRILGARAVV